MAYTVQTTVVKPANSKWFGVDNYGTAMTDLNWLNAQPGFVSRYRQIIDENTAITTLTYEDKAAHDRISAARALTDAYQRRRAHYITSGFQETIAVI
jgi:hypothetical protein